MRKLKSLFKAILPQQAVGMFRQYKLARMHRQNARVGTEQIFTDIYANNVWGGEPGTFSSGSGSTTDAVTAPYVTSVREWLGSIDAATKTIVDLGCGDFRIGQQLTDLCGHYIGVDIVGSLVEHNIAKFSAPNIEFRKLNIVEDALPDGDICFLRQVLQHLSNSQIQAILPKLNKYQWALITEHQPSSARLKRANIDKPHGGDIRVFQGSGVFLEEEPFSIPADRLRLLLEVPGHDLGAEDPGVIRTFLLTSAC